MLTIETKTGRAKLSRQDVADWLGVGVDNVSSIESGRVRLTRENAQIIMQQTGASLKWLRGEVDSSPVHWSGRAYQQKHFDEAQRQIKSPSLPALKAQRALAETVGQVATILLRAVQHDEFERYAAKMKRSVGD